MSEHERVQKELSTLDAERTTLETELMRHDVYRRVKQEFPNATAGYPLYGR